MFIALPWKINSYKLTLLIFILTSFNGSGLCKNSNELTLASDSCRNKAHLTILSTPGGAVIKINGQYLGRTPIYNYCIDIGSHLLLGLNPDRTHWAAMDWLQTISVSPGDSLNFAIDFQKLKDDPGSDGLAWQSEAGIESARPGGTRPQQALWQPGDSRAAASTGSGSAKSWKKIALVSSIAVAVLSGLASVHYRDQANTFYASYQKAGNPALMDQYFDKTRYYDRVSGLCYGIFQVSFVTTLYLYLSSGSK